jgi:hypothetical protein
MTPQSPRGRTVFATGVVIVLAGLTALAIAAVRLTTSDSVPASAVPGVTQTPAAGACLDNQQARGVWNDVTARLDALSLHPDTTKVSDVAEGTAGDEIRQYLQSTLISKGLTEREKERLDDLTVVQAGCNGEPLTVNLTETLVQDDYLAKDGHVDHQDPSVGQSLHMLESYVRSGSTWKLIALTSLDQPTSNGNIV